MRSSKPIPTPLNAEVLKPGKPRRKALEGKHRRYDKANHRQKAPVERGGGDTKKGDGRKTQTL